MSCTLMLSVPVNGNEVPFNLNIHTTNDRYNVSVNNEHCGWSYAAQSIEPDTYELVLNVEPLSGDIDFDAIARTFTPEEHVRMESLYKGMKFVLEMMDCFISNMSTVDDNDPMKRELINRYVKLIEALEFAMQGEWGIRKDPNYHTWWFKSRHCTCPKLDNCDPLYFGHGKIINNTCPVHGHK